MSAPLIEQLTEIRQAHGSLTPRLLVDLAQAPNHPLHSRFEWDDRIAGDKWRLEQAAQLLRVVYKPDPTKPTELRAFSVVRGEESPVSEYVPTEEVLADPFARELLLRRMKTDWQVFKRRYDHMAEFATFIREQVEGTAV